MKGSRYPKPFLGIVRFAIIVCVCALVTFSSVLPAYSNPVKDTSSYGKSSPTNPQKGEDQLTNIEQKTWDFLKPENTFSSEKIQDEANKGLNEIQGDADIDKMKRPSNSRNATSIEQQIQQNLSKAQDKQREAVHQLVR